MERVHQGWAVERLVEMLTFYTEYLSSSLPPSQFQLPANVSLVRQLVLIQVGRALPPKWESRIGFQLCIWGISQQMRGFSVCLLFIPLPLFSKIKHNACVHTLTHE